jgi:hypothetical protein
MEEIVRKGMLYAMAGGCGIIIIIIFRVMLKELWRLWKGKNAHG